MNIIPARGRKLTKNQDIIFFSHENEHNPRKGTETYGNDAFFRPSLKMNIIPARGRKPLTTDYINIGDSFMKMNIIPARGRKLLLFYCCSLFLSSRK